MIKHDDVAPQRSIDRGTSWHRYALLAALIVGFTVASMTATAIFVVLPAERLAADTDHWVEHTHQVIETLDDILISADDAETGQRGFLLTENMKFLEPYESGTKAIWRYFATVQDLTADDLGQQSRVQTLRGLLDAKLAELARPIAAARGGNLQAAADIVREGKGKAIMDDIRRLTAEMVTAEQGLLRARRLDQTRSQQWANQIVTVLLILGGCGMVLSGAGVAVAGAAANARRQSAATAAERLRLLSMLDLAPVAVRDLGGAIQFWSQGCRRLYGWTAEQAIGQILKELLHTVASIPLGDVEADLLRQGEWNGELRQLTQSGAEVIVQAHKVLWRDPDDSGARVLETLVDVTELRQTEAALERSRLQFQSVVNAAADAIVIAGPDGAIESVNPAVLEMFGYTSSDELLGRDLGALIPAIEAAHLGHDIAGRGREAGVQAIGMPGSELMAVRHDRSEFPVDLSVSSFDSDGRRYFTGIIRDASRRRHTETVLRDSEARLRRFIDEAPAAIAMFDTAMRYLAVSQRFVSDYQIHDQTPLIGRCHYDVFPNISDDRRIVHRRGLAGETLSGDNEPYLRRDGSTGWVRWEMVPWRQADGTVGGVMLFSQDQSDRKAAEAALYDSEARLRLVQRVSGIAYTDRTDPEPEALVSAEFNRIYGLPPERTRVPLSEILARIHPDDRERIAALISASLTDVAKLAEEYRICRPDGEVRWISLRSESFLGPTGRPNRIISAQQDITEIVTAREALVLRHNDLERLSLHLAQARDKAEKASRAKSRFLAGMSHELRSPLNGILGHAHLLQMDGGLNPAQDARINAMLEAGRHLLEMITCVLDLSEIEANHVNLRPVELDARATAMACLDLVRPMAEQKGLAVHISIAPDAPLRLLADPTRFRQILLNLLGNATKFTSQGAIELRLRTVRDGRTLRIEVADTGPGIPADERQRLFQDFERLTTEATRAAEGAGLGLAISTRLATLMGGGIGHEDNPGGGSVFWLELPLEPATTLPTTALPTTALSEGAADDPDVAEAEPISPPVRACHVLVVDDIAMNRDIASAFLSRAGQTVTCVEGGAEAVAAAASKDFDVVLMDVRMPGMDGLEATRRIRALEGRRGQVPIVALTAQAFTDQVEECHNAGMDSHLAKPFESRHITRRRPAGVCPGRANGGVTARFNAVRSAGRAGRWLESAGTTIGSAIAASPANRPDCGGSGFSDSGMS